MVSPDLPLVIMCVRYHDTTCASNPHHQFSANDKEIP